MDLKHAGIALACAMALLAGRAVAQAPAEEGKTAEQQFKNIQVLKGTPADQLIPAMQFISASLGVKCDFCHVQGKFDSDEKQAKQTARHMITMTLAINKDYFNGHKDVTCNSCHNGHEEPTSTPPVATADMLPEHNENAEAANPGQTTPEQVLEKYLAAVGGADALQKVNSRVEKGTISAMGHDSPIEVFAAAPDKRATVAHMPNGDSITAFDGKIGWLGNTGRPPHDMSAAETEAFKLDADLYFPVHVKTLFTQLRMGHPEKIGDEQTYTVVGIRQGQPPVRLYFDASSGLLVRMVRYADTPIGRNPTQIDYADYRDVDGVKVPFRWTLARPGGRFTIQIQEAKQNVPIEDDKFAKPASK
jgi:photosynthetic reaction center cytochrome c subunit